MKYTIKLVVAVVALLSVGAPNTYAQKEIKPLAKAITATPTEVLAKVEKFVAQQGHWPRVSIPQEAPLYRQVAKLMYEAHQAKTLTPEMQKLQQFKRAVTQTELETQTLKELKTFIAQQGRLPRTEIRSIYGTKNKIEHMTPSQLTEFRLAQQIAYIQAKYPGSAISQQIQALKETVE